MDIYGDRLLHCEKRIHILRLHDCQIRLLESDLIKAAGHIQLSSPALADVIRNVPISVHEEATAASVRFLSRFAICFPQLV